MANKLWPTANNKWSINGPHESGSLIFECILNLDRDDQALKWVLIEIDH